MALEIFDQSDEWSESGPDKNIALKLQVFQVIQVFQLFQVCPGLSSSVSSVPVCPGLVNQRTLKVISLESEGSNG